MDWDVAVIGAGMAGLTSARHLQQQGYRVVVLDKSRGLGGRMATRRVASIPIDHGCRYLQGTSTQLQRLVTAAQAQGILQPWQPRIAWMDGQKLRDHGPLAPPLWIASAGMTAWAKWLAQDLTLRRQLQVEQLTPLEGKGDFGGWRIKARTQEATAVEVQARSLVLAIPAPQALVLIKSVDVAGIPSDSLGETLAQVSYHGCLTVMAGYADPPAPRWSDLPLPASEGWMLLGDEPGSLRWVGLDNAKGPRSEAATVVFHSGSNYAQPYLDGPKLALEDGGMGLIRHAQAYFHSDLGHPDWLQCHRWRYATVKTPAPQSALRFLDSPPLAMAGDWTQGDSVADALESGLQAAAYIQGQL